MLNYVVLDLTMNAAKLVEMLRRKKMDGASIHIRRSYGTSYRARSEFLPTVDV
jgi:hypothetical protein